MDKGQGQWDKLVNMPQEYEENPAIVQKAVEELSQKRAKPKTNWFFRQWKAIVACAAAVVLGVGVGIPLYNKFSTPQVVYYEENDIVYEKVENVDAYMSNKDLNIRYFVGAAVANTRIATIIETEEVAFLEQDTLHMNDFGFDEVILYSVVKKNVEVKFKDNFEGLSNVHTLADISISYTVFENLNMGNRQILARFSYENADYYLDIVTEQDAIQQLEVYVNMLLR